MDENKPRRPWLSFGVRDLLWAMVVVGLGLGWWLDRSSLKDSVHYLDWKAYHLMNELDTAEKVEVDENGNLSFEHNDGILHGVRYPREADRRKAWDEFRSLSEP
jgi:hypothetical protein